MAEKCDHTSVGMLVWRDGKLLVIERKKPPYGIAPPAGHVDDQGSFEEAAALELKDEVGLDSTIMTLATSGVRFNPCRREDGTWHYWRVYWTSASGMLKPSQDETKSVHWVTLAEISALAARTEDYIAGKIPEDAWQAMPGLEPVWREIFQELRLLSRPPNTDANADIAWARDYNWKWFTYHAGQRMTVFQYYLVVLAFLSAGYSTLITNRLSAASGIVALLLLLVTYLFWRSGLRNQQLVKVSEDFLKTEERMVAARIRRPELAMAGLSEDKWHGWPFSFREIYALLFAAVGVLCILMVGWSAWQLVSVPPSPDTQKIDAIVRFQSQALPAQTGTKARGTEYSHH